MKKILVPLMMLLAVPAFAYSFVTVQKTDGSMALRNTRDGFDAFVLQNQGAPGMPYVLLSDDFVGSSLNSTLWSAVSGTTAKAPVVTVSNSGVVSMTTGTVANTASGQAQLSGQAIFLPSKGGMSMEASVAPQATTSSTIFVGFTDTAALELPAYVNGTSATATATNAVGFVYTTSATNLTWQGVGVKDDVTKTVVNTSVSATTGFNNVLRVDVDSSGNADFYVNGVWKKRIASAVSASIPLSPIVAIQPTAASVTNNLWVDYVRAGTKR